MKKFGFVVLMFALVAVTGKAQADSIMIDFEAPTYDLGPITSGEDGWSVLNPAYDQSVVNVNPISGLQSWIISSSYGQGSFGDQPFSPALAVAAGENAPNNYFEASMKFKPLETNATGDGVTLSTDNGSGQRMDWTRIDYDGAGWGISFYDYDGTNFVQSASTALLADTVYDLKYSRKFNAGPDNDVWEAFLNNTLIFTGVGWEGFFADGAPTFGPSPVTMDRILFRNAVSAPGSQGVMFDDIQYSSSLDSPAPVPEPASLLLLGAGMIVVGVVRQRRMRAARTTK